jgi:hypothetical protein
MFDHVKHVVSWTTMACHVYDSAYCKVMTITVCDMQFQETKAQQVMVTSSMKHNFPKTEFQRIYG